MAAGGGVDIPFSSAILASARNIEVSGKMKTDMTISRTDVEMDCATVADGKLDERIEPLGKQIEMDRKLSIVRTDPFTSVTVNGVSANEYADGTFAATGFTPVNGNNTFTAIAQDWYGRGSTNSITAYLPASPSYTNDLNGNLLGDGTRIFGYDDENQLVSVWVANTWSNSFAYDGLLRKRVERDYTWNGSSWVKTNELRFIYDGYLVIQERDANNLPQVTYTRGNDLSGDLQDAGGIGGLLARTDMGLWTVGSGQATAFYQADGNGNITCLVNTNGTILARYEYDPYGNMLSMSGPLAGANHYRFSSKEWNDNTGLYYYGFRFYDPNLQRWLNRDPIQELGCVNLFEFSDNSSINCIDLWGLVWYNPFSWNWETILSGISGKLGPKLGLDVKAKLGPCSVSAGASYGIVGEANLGGDAHGEWSWGVTGDMGLKGQIGPLQAGAYKQGYSGVVNPYDPDKGPRVKEESSSLLGVNLKGESGQVGSDSQNPWKVSLELDAALVDAGVSVDFKQVCNGITQ